MLQQQMPASPQPEPASKLYVLGDGWHSLRASQVRLTTLAQKGAQQWWSYVVSLNETNNKTGCFFGLFLFPTIFFCIIMSIVTYGFTMLIMLMFTLVCTTILASGAGFCLATITVLRFANWLYMSIWHISYDCPKPYCYARESLPIFKCPQCQVEHPRLRPSIYGIRKHRCHCGAQLPTMERSGRSKLVRICPRCRDPLSHDIGQGTNIHFPLIGGPLSGKTHYAVAALAELMHRYTSTYNYHFSFSNPLQETAFQDSVRRLKYGQALAATPEIAPQAYTLKIDIPGVSVAKMLYLYDAAGEAYNANERTNLQSYYKYIRGLLFIIDPCAISSFRLRYEAQINAISSSLRPCESEIMQVYDRMMRMLEKKHGVRRWKRYSFPIAVIVTKVDALDLDQKIGSTAAKELMRRDPSYASEGDAINALVQDFLQSYGLSNLLRNLDYHFSSVRYFSCSALGRLPVPTDTRSFIPVRTLDPFVWLLTQSGVVKATQQ